MLSMRPRPTVGLLSFSAGGRQLVSSGSHTFVWNVPEARIVWEFEMKRRPLHMAFSISGAVLWAPNFKEKSIEFDEPGEWSRPVRKFPVQDGPDVRFGLVGLCLDDTAMLWRGNSWLSVLGMSSGRTVRRFGRHVGGHVHASISTDGSEGGQRLPSHPTGGLRHRHRETSPADGSFLVRSADWRRDRCVRNQRGSLCCGQNGQPARTLPKTGSDHDN